MFTHKKTFAQFHLSVYLLLPKIFNLKLTFGPSHENLRFKNDIRQAKELPRSQAVDIQFMFKSKSFICFFHSVIIK